MTDDFCNLLKNSHTMAVRGTSRALLSEAAAGELDRCWTEPSAIEAAPVVDEGKEFGGVDEGKEFGGVGCWFLGVSVVVVVVGFVVSR